MHSSSAGPKLAVSLALVTMLGPSAIDMYLASMPEMAASLNTPFSHVQLTLTAFLLALGLGQLLFGPMVDAFGRRRPLLVGILAFAIAGAVAAMAQSVDALLYARFFQGLAASLTLVVAMSTVRDVAHGTAAAKLFALLMTIEGLAPVLAPAVGGFIDAAFGWRGVMWVLAAMGVVVFCNSLINLPETLPPDKRSSMHLGRVFATYGRIISDTQFFAPALALSAAFFFLFAYIGGAGLVYQQHFGLTPPSFGMIFGATGIAVLIGAMGSARLVSRFGVSGLAARGCMMILLGAAIALGSAAAGLGIAGVAAGMFVSMIGIGVAEATLMSIAMASQERSLGSTAALLGGMQLTIASAATPLAANTSSQGTMAWVASLLIIAVVVLVLAIVAAKGNRNDTRELAGH